MQFNHERQIFPWLLGIFLFILPDSRKKVPCTMGLLYKFLCDLAEMRKILNRKAEQLWNP